MGRGDRSGPTLQFPRRTRWAQSGRDLAQRSGKLCPPSSRRPRLAREMVDAARKSRTGCHTEVRIISPGTTTRFAGYKSAPPRPATQSPVTSGSSVLHGTLPRRNARRSASVLAKTRKAFLLKLSDALRPLGAGAPEGGKRQAAPARFRQRVDRRPHSLRARRRGQLSDRRRWGQLPSGFPPQGRGKHIGDRRAAARHGVWRSTGYDRRT